MITTFYLPTILSAAKLIEKAHREMGFAPRDNTIRITAVDGEAVISYFCNGMKSEFNLDIKVPCQGDDIDIVMSALLLVSILKQVNENEVSFVDCGTNIVIETPTSQTKITKLECDFDSNGTIPAVKNGLVLSLSKNSILELLNQTVSFICTDPLRYYLGGIFVEADKKKLFAVATNARLLIKRKLGKSPYKKFDVIIPLEVLATIRRLATKNKTIEITLNQQTKTGAITTDTVNFRFKTIDGSFPDYKHVIPAPHKDDIEIKFNKGALAAALHQAMSIITDTRAVQLGCDKTGWKISSYTPIHNCETRVKHGPQPVQNFDGVSFNPLLMLDCLAAVKAKTVKIVINGADPKRGPIRITFKDSKAVLVVLMPMAMANDKKEAA